MDLFYKYFSNHSLHIFKAFLFTRSFASTHTGLLFVGWWISCFCLLWAKLQVLPESLLNPNSGRRHGRSVPCWWHKMEKSCLKFLLKEKNPGLLNIAWRTFVLMKNRAWKTGFSHGAANCSPKINAMPISGRENSQLITQQRMGTRGLPLSLPFLPMDKTCRIWWKMPGSGHLTGELCIISQMKFTTLKGCRQAQKGRKIIRSYITMQGYSTEIWIYEKYITAKIFRHH